MNRELISYADVARQLAETSLVSFSEAYETLLTASDAIRAAERRAAEQAWDEGWTAGVLDSALANNGIARPPAANPYRTADPAEQPTTGPRAANSPQDGGEPRSDPPEPAERHTAIDPWADIPGRLNATPTCAEILAAIPDAYNRLADFIHAGSAPPDPDHRRASNSPTRAPANLAVLDLLDPREKPDTAPTRRGDTEHGNPIADDRMAGRRQGILPTLSSWVREIDSAMWDEGDEHQNPPTQRTVPGECELTRPGVSGRSFWRFTLPFGGC